MKWHRCPIPFIFVRAGHMLTVWACFLHNALSFLEKNGWPSREVEQTCCGSQKHKEECYYSNNILSIFLSLDLTLVVPVSVIVSWTYRTHKAGVMPGESKSLQELVPSFDGEVTAVAVGPKQLVVVWVKSPLTKCYFDCRFSWQHPIYGSYCTLFTVWLPILHVEHVASDWLLAGDTGEAGHMPGLFQGIHDLLHWD